MVSLNSSLYVGLSGVRSAQVGINVTGNNIANISTEGYSRQRPDTTVKGVFTSEGLTFGTGSDVSRVFGLRDDLAEAAVTQFQASNSYHEELASSLAEAEALMVDGEYTGISKALGDFFSSLERATQRPNDLATRQDLITAGNNISEEINGRYNDLGDEQARINIEIEDLVNKVNDLTLDIQSLNRQISSVAKPAEDLIDQRRMAINELAKLVGVETIELPNNMVQVSIKGSNQILVGREIRNTLGVQTNAANFGFNDVTIDVGGTVTVITGTVETGEVGAKLQMRDVELNDLRRDLDRLAAGLIIQVNTIHDTGTDLNGNTNLRFFDPDNATVLGATAVGTIDPDRYLGVAGTMSLSDDLRPAAGQPFDPTRIALSATGSVGDNGIALQLANLRDNQDVIDQDLDGDPTNDSPLTYEKFYGGVMAQLGRKVELADTTYITQNELLNQAEIRRDESAGVNLDEEAVQLTEYQRAFEASSRFLSVINQLTGEILTRLGS